MVATFINRILIIFDILVKPTSKISLNNIFYTTKTMTKEVKNDNDNCKYNRLCLGFDWRNKLGAHWNL